jgi:ferrous iron transport protein A
MRLNTLKKGQKATVKEILSKDFSTKLIGLGVVKGQQIESLYKAPFGGPIAYQIGSYVLALRPSEAKLIDVDILADHE